MDAERDPLGFYWKRVTHVRILENMEMEATHQVVHGN